LKKGEEPMKKIYQDPAMEIVRFACVDVITNSNELKEWDSNGADGNGD
jgi:hypothetical protein